MITNLPKLYFISQAKEVTEHLEQIDEVFSEGVELIQLRIKNTPEDKVYDVAQKAQKIARKYKGQLIINDYPNIAKALNMDGVHLGQNDTSITKARELLGANKIIGGTANTISDIHNLLDNGVSYIGLGPYSYTTTKQNLSPLLGIKGYKNLSSQIKRIIPIYAIGGIEIKDINLLMQTGIHGIAVSGIIARSKNKKHTISQLKKALQQK